ncbi:MFS transporter [Janibacter cremeus]|uniref:CP family cyanate transporter-like MFS transporter n=1 Tax=Janibacter cremeus TaxID=1285192 RepID=A0A852VPA6_9MICO|nr:MFS transporter [Janibacter cremeus]NYF97538.1 CP family cyanate transporter-like MFS transporter [Janibacter cremeus]
MSAHHDTRQGPPFPAVLIVIGVALISINLRPGATSIGPLLEELSTALSLGPTVAGLLTAMPGFTFAAAGAVAVSLAHRVGLSKGITIGVVALVLTLLARVLTDSSMVFIGLTTIGLAGMGLGNVLVPAWIKAHSRDGGVRLMTIYSMGLTIGGAMGALVTAPLASIVPGQWRGALAVWGLVALLALLPWLVISAKDRVHRRTDSVVNGRMAHSPTAIALTALFGMQSMNAYVQFGWLPQIYRDAGLSATSAGALTAIVTGLGILGGLLMPTIIDRGRHLSAWMVSFGVLAAGGYLGLLVAPATLPWLWAGLLGISGFAFPTAIALITARSRDPRVTAQLSGFVQPVGYLLAGFGPLAVGVLHAATGGWTLVLVLLMLSGLGITLAGLRVAKPVFVDDEMAARIT